MNNFKFKYIPALIISGICGYFSDYFWFINNCLHKNLCGKSLSVFGWYLAFIAFMIAIMSIVGLFLDDDK